MSLDSSDPMEKADKFMRNGIFMKEGDFFNGVEDNGSFKDGGVE